MSQRESLTVQCLCGVRIAWCDEHAGQVVHCGCGKRLRLPADEAAVRAGDAVLRDLGAAASADLVLCPACAVVLSPDTAVCVACGWNRQEGRRAQIDRDREPTEKELMIAAAARRESRIQMYGAIGLIAGCAVVLTGVVWSQTGLSWELLLVPALVLAWGVAKLATMWFALLFAARMTGDDLGPAWEAAVKLVAVGVTTHTARLLVLAATGLSFALIGGGAAGGGMETMGSAMMTVAIAGFAFLIVPIVVILVVASWLFGLSYADRVFYAVFLYLSETIGFIVLMFAGLPG